MWLKSQVTTRKLLPIDNKWKSKNASPSNYKHKAQGEETSA